MLTQEEIKVSYIDAKEIHEDNEFNCRGKVTPIDVHDLITSIRERGLDSPIIVREYDTTRREATGHRYGLVAGYRRLCAMKSLDMTSIPCIIRHDISDTEARIINLQENLIRKDLNILQEAKAIEKLKIAGYTQQEVADQLHKSTGWVQIRFKLLSFPEDIQQECAKGIIGQSHINAIATLPKEKQYEAVQRIKKKRLSGEKGLIVPRPVAQNSRRARNRHEMVNMLDHIYENLGASFTTRTLAWCVGNISSAELFRDIKEECRKEGKSYIIPEEEL